MQISRRAFISLAAAGLVSAAVPSVPQAGPVSEFGFSLDGELYQTGFADRAAAEEAARLYSPGSAFQVAEVTYHALCGPSEGGEAAVDHLINDRTLGSDLVEWLVCANEEGDYEGDFADACHRALRADRAAVEGPARMALAEALRRAGQPAAAETVAAGGNLTDHGDLPDAAYEALAADAALSDAWERHMLAWAEANDLGNELRGLQVTSVEEHPAPAPSAVAA